MRSTRWITRAEAMVEAQRCLGCYDAPCRQACPAGVDVPVFIRRLREENVQGAGEVIYESCPLGATCGMACPTDTLCEGACVLKGLGQTPIRIGSLQAFASAYYEPGEAKIERPFPMRTAIIGAGPSGLGCAVELNRLGHEVHVFDESDRLTGLVDKVIPAHRLPEEAIATDLKRLDQSGIHLHLGKKVDGAQVQTLKEDFDTIFIAAGQGSINEFSPKGWNNPGVISAMDFLAQARNHTHRKSRQPEIGKIVAVIGGGNVALDASVTAKRFGAERVIVLYRRTKEQMPGWESEYLEAAGLGVEFRWLSIVEEVLGSNNRVSAVKVGSMSLGKPGPDGRRQVVPDQETPQYILHCDQVIHALGQTLDLSLTTNFSLQTTPKGVIQVDPLTFQTSNPTIFAGGECVTGGSTIVNSLNQGMKAAHAMHAYWQEKADKS